MQSQAGIAFVPKAEVAESETVKEMSARARYAEEMRAEIPADRSEDPERWRVHELLSWFLEFHRRENKPVWWFMYERNAMTDQELIDDPDCLGGLVRTDRPPEKVKRSFAYEYRFDPEQETKLRQGSKCIFAHDLMRKTTIETFEPAEGRLTIKLTGAAPPSQLGLIPDEWVSPKVIEQSIERIVRTVPRDEPPAAGDRGFPVPPAAPAEGADRRADHPARSRSPGGFNRRGGGSG